MSDTIKLSIFGGERCVTTRAALEEAVRSITARAVSLQRAREVPKLVTYPARPIQGGRLELAPPKRGVWYAEPKFNGWRALVHCPSGTMWNRHGRRLAIAQCFTEALSDLRDLADDGLIWADCEALERRHDIARGTLILLDAIPADAMFTPSYTERRAFLESVSVPMERFSCGINELDAPPLLLTTSLLACDHNEVLALYQSLHAVNRRLRCEFFEGVVMKRGDAAYPVQLRSSTEECRTMMKHRFLN